MYILTGFVITSMFFSKKASDEHFNWISMPAACKEGCEGPGDMYGEAYMKYSPEETSAQFRKEVNMVPWDIMR